jgi:ABC-type transport system substrate-binding protein
MLTRRTLLATSTASLAAPAIIGSADAATPKNTVVMAKQIDDIIGGFDPAQSYEFANNECCGNIYRKLIVPDPEDTDKLVGDLAEKSARTALPSISRSARACCSTAARNSRPRTWRSACNGW